MEKKNLILITMDEVRADHLTCYGYEKTTTNNIDNIAEDGVRFRTCIASSVLTPVSHASLLSGLHPYSNGVRGPFDRFSSQTLAEILKSEGYRTAGFVGNSMLGVNMGFNKGFESFDEPKNDDIFMWELHAYKDPRHPNIRFPWGNWWIDRMINWIEKNMDEKFFTFGHFFHTHEGSERQLIDMGLISSESAKSEFGFYDEKINLCDEMFIGPIIRTLKRNGIYNDTTLVITADHGTTLGERLLPPLPWRKNVIYPQHTTMYEPDITVPLIIKDKDLPSNITVEQCVKHLDIFPTLMRLLEIKTPVNKEGIDLVPLIEGEEVEGFKSYIEDLYLYRGLGAIQAIRTERFKYIMNQTMNKEEFYDLYIDPQEKKNRIYDLSPEERLFVKSSRRETEMFYKTLDCELHYTPTSPMKSGNIGNIQDKEKEIIIERLRALGYI